MKLRKEDLVDYGLMALCLIVVIMHAMEGEWRLVLWVSLTLLFIALGYKLRRQLVDCIDELDKMTDLLKAGSNALASCGKALDAGRRLIDQQQAHIKAAEVVCEAYYTIAAEFCSEDEITRRRDEFIDRRAQEVRSGQH